MIQTTRATVCSYLCGVSGQECREADGKAPGLDPCQKAGAGSNQARNNGPDLLDQRREQLSCAPQRHSLAGRASWEERQAGIRERGLYTSTRCRPCSASALPAALPLHAQEGSISISLRPKLYSNKERKEKRGTDYINHTAFVETPIIFFPKTWDNLCVFCYAHFSNSFSFVFTCWPCAKKSNLTSCVFSAKKVSVPGLNVSCSQIKAKKHKSWHILFISWFTSMMFLSTLFCYYCWCFAHNVVLAAQKCLSPTDKYSY